MLRRHCCGPKSPPRSPSTYAIVTHLTPCPGLRKTTSRRLCRRETKVVTKAVSVAETAPRQGTVEYETDPRGHERIKLKRNGWGSWTWQGHRVNFCQAGDQGSPIVLVHGFGASVYHWRYNIPELAKSHRVFALDMLGFGWSAKPVLEYSGCSIWASQVGDFIREVVGEPAVLVGNSLGGYTSLLAASLAPDQVKGVVLLNSAGRFSEGQAAVETALQDESSSPIRKAVQAEAQPADRSPEPGQEPASTSGRGPEGENEEQPGMWSRLWEPVRTLGMRAAVYGAFIATKQPFRIRQVLKQVYLDHSNVDEDLVQSIVLPATDPNAAAIFYKVITGWGQPVPDLLGRLQAPLLLLWGELDPWIGPGKAGQIRTAYPKADYVGLQAGHCPQDEAPEKFNQALLEWMAKSA